MTHPEHLIAGAWGVAATVRIVRARGLSLTVISCVAFLLVTALFAEPRAGLNLLGIPGYGLALDLGWLLALALTGHWLMLGYYGAVQPPWARPARLAVVIAATALLASWLAGWQTAQWVVFHLAALPLVAGVVTLTLLCAHVTRGRHRLSLLTLATAGWLTCEGLLIDIDLHDQPGAQAFTTSALDASLATASLALYLVALGLPLLPHRSRTPDPRAIPALEALWGWLAPTQPPLRIDEHSDTGVWISDAVIALRDRIGTLQTWCPRTALRLAERAWRRNGLTRRRARVMAVAECLRRAQRAEHRGQSTCNPHANLIGLGGGRWLDAEVAWFVELHDALAQLTTHHPATTPTSSAVPEQGGALADPELVARCEQRLEEWLPAPRPATISAIRAAVARRRGRAIGVLRHRQLRDRAYYYRVLDLDLVLIDHQPNELLRTVAEAHELGHLIWDHQPEPLAAAEPDQQALDRLRAATPELPATLVQGLLARCDDWRDDPKEAEAEITGQLLVRHLLHAPGAGLARFLEER